MLPKDVLGLGQKGSDTSTLKTSLMQAAAAAKLPLTQLQINETIAAHHSFLAKGGAGGKWKVFSINGWNSGLYLLHNDIETSKEQANLEGKNLTSISFEEVTLPFANFCGCFATDSNFSGGNFVWSLFCDADFSDANFAKANLQHCDFSRANLKQANLSYSDLRGTDFENCNLIGANLTGANTKGCKLFGAIIEGVIWGN